jgi:hypothetical protein
VSKVTPILAVEVEIRQAPADAAQTLAYRKLWRLLLAGADVPDPPQHAPKSTPAPSADRAEELAKE